MVMLTVVVSLVSISFSYYVDESSNQTKLVTLSQVENELKSADLEEGVVTVLPNETKEIILYVISNNAFLSQCKLYYKGSDEVEIYTDVDYYQLDAYEVKQVPITIVNKGENSASITLGIENGYMNNEIVLKDKEVRVNR